MALVELWSRGGIQRGVGGPPLHGYPALLPLPLLEQNSTPTVVAGIRSLLEQNSTPEVAGKRSLLKQNSTPTGAGISCRGSYIHVDVDVDVSVNKQINESNDT